MLFRFQSLIDTTTQTQSDIQTVPMSHSVGFSFQIFCLTMLNCLYRWAKIRQTDLGTRNISSSKSFKPAMSQRKQQSFREALSTSRHFQTSSERAGCLPPLYTWASYSVHLTVGTEGAAKPTAPESALLCLLAFVILCIQSAPNHLSPVFNVTIHASSCVFIPH